MIVCVVQQIQPTKKPAIEAEPRLADRGIIAMSGGVDSSVAASMLVAEGHDVVAIAMRLYETAPKSDRSCCSPDDLFDARSVAARLDIPFYVANYVEDFRQTVIDYFVAEYRRGRTPNPCVACNNHLKFDVLLERAQALGGAWLATGHYSIIDCDESGRYRLRRGRDPAKDQSYFLFGLPRQALSRIRFPLGELTKEQVRELASEAGLPTATKPESQEICFVTGRSYADFVRERIADGDVVPGEFRHIDGEVLGQHDGVHQFTIGQRRGLGIAYPEPLYVLAIDADSGVVTVGPRPALGAAGLTAERFNWLRWDTPPPSFRALVQIRYRAPAVPATVSTEDHGEVRVTFDEPQRAVAPGQAVVLYDDEDDEVLGGGFIQMAIPATRHE